MIKIQNTQLHAISLVRFFVENNITPIFDIDGVLADASHRQICNPDGSLNLEKYREMSTAEYIAKDKELPLIEAIKLLNDLEVNYHVCTARVACENTVNWLQSKGINPIRLMARDGEEDTRKDYELKTDKIAMHFTPSQREKMALIDDNIANCEAAKNLGLKAFHVPFFGH